MKTILIVDDEPDVLAIVRMRLARNPQYRILEATNGADAVKLAAQRRPDLVILDWLMPGLSGKEALKAIRENPDLAEIRVIMMTVKGDRAAQAESEALGAFAYLVKPFDGDLLLDKIQEALQENR